MYEDILRGSRRLPQYGTLLVSGAEAVPFLQGQVSTNINTLTPQSVLLTSCNSAQGRVQSVLWIAARGADLVLMTSAELVEITAARLRKYVLRAKVNIEPAPLEVYGRGDGVVPESWSAPLAQTQTGDCNVIRWPGDRTLIVAPRQEHADDDAFVLEWRRGDVACGIPTLHTETHESFVAQMLNLDLLGGISFDKGCYTGQEIIARTHYRGTVKRRMFRYAADAAPPAPGTRVIAGDGVAGEVVTAVPTTGGCELLAVVQLSQMQQELMLDGSRAVLKSLPLPYAVS
jgi:folate-binding protein YgfZ